MSHRSSTHTSTHTPTVASTSTFRTTAPADTTPGPSCGCGRAENSARGGAASLSPVARNAVVHPVHAAPGASGFVLDYQI